MNTVTGEFNTVQRAEEAVMALRDARFSDDDIGIVVHDSKKGDTLASDLRRRFMHGAPSGDVITDNTIFDTLPPAFIDNLHRAEMPDDAVNWYNSHLDAGDILLIVNSHDRMDDAIDIIERHGGELYHRERRGMREGAMAEGAKTAEAAKVTTGAEEIHVPVVDEEVVVEKTRHQVGQVEVMSTTTTESIDVPTTIMHDEVRVERRRLDHPMRLDEYKASPTGEGVIRVPIVEEEVTVTKMPVIREELVVVRQPITEQRVLHETVMHTEPQLRGTGDVDIGKDVDLGTPTTEETRKRPAA